MIAARYLRARRKEAFISVIASLTMVGVAIGVATLIVVMSVMNGFRGELLDKILGLNGHFTAYPIESQFTDYKETVDALQTVNGVKFAVYYAEGQVLASGRGGSTGVSVRGMVEFDSLFMFMPLQTAQDYFKLYDDVLKPGQGPLDPMASDEEIDAAYERIYRASGAEIFIDDPDNVAAMRERIAATPGLRPLLLNDWQQRNETFFSALQVERVVMFTILSMIVLVAAFNIISSLVMLVKDKSKDIAVLRTMGATRGAIMRIFSITGTTIGVVGTLSGLVLGLIVAANAEALRSSISNLLGVTLFPPEVFFLSSLPSKTDPTEVTVVVVMALGLSFLATLYPAWRAAQYDPVEALRYE
jgi:ABC-type lipoprotein release transport system permease subunit